MDASVRQMRAFLAVADSGQFTRAAQELGIAQSTLSTAIRDLELSLNVKLFDRHTRMLQLTQAGTEFLPFVRRLISDLDTTITTMRSHASLERGKVTIAAPGLQSALWLPDEIARFSERYPEIEIILHDLPEVDVAEQVRSGLADVGLMTSTAVPIGLRSTTVGSDSYIAVTLPGVESRPIQMTWHSLSGNTLIGMQSRSPMRRALDEALLEHGIRLSFKHEVIQPLTMLGMVRAGLGTAIVTSLMEPLAKNMGLQAEAIAEPNICRELTVVHSLERSLSPAAYQFHRQLTKLQEANPRR